MGRGGSTPQSPPRGRGYRVGAGGVGLSTQAFPLPLLVEPGAEPVSSGQPHPQLLVGLLKNP